MSQSIGAWVYTMARARPHTDLATTIRRLGEPSWLILDVLDAAQAIPAVEIMRRVGHLLQAAGIPCARLDQTTMHYALKRLEELDLIHTTSEQAVVVPVGHNTNRVAQRAVYVRTVQGEQAVARRRQLVALGAQRIWAS